MTPMFPADSPFLTTDPRRHRWAIPYNPECANARVDVLLAQNRDLIDGMQVLDLACHRGTFSYAALRLGARRVVGIDSEAKVIGDANALLTESGLNPNDYDFQVGDVFEFLERQETGAFDTVFCFGLLYYTTEPYRLLKLMRRVARRAIVLDTFTAAYAAVQGKDSLDIFPHVNDDVLNLPLMLVTMTQAKKNDYRLPESFPKNNRDLSLTGFPTVRLLELWMESLQMDFRQLKWTPYIQRACTWKDLYTPEQKKASHWADVYSAQLRVAYRITP